jgi:hypothetical protein
MAFAITAGAALVVACGDDDSGASSSSGGVDSGPGVDGSKVDSGSSSGNVDSGDAGTQCTFAGFVINLINTDTTASAQPSTDLGDNCTPSTDQADFQSLF